MPPIEKAVIMAFGAVLALIGVVLFAKGSGKTEGTNKIKFSKLEFEFSAPSLFIFVVGCGLLVFPYFLGEGQRAVNDLAVAPNATGSGLAANVTPAADGKDGSSADRQAALEARLADLQTRLDQAERGAPAPQSSAATAITTPAAPAATSIAGQWNSATGSTYVLQQQGSRVSIQEYTQGMISAVGEGTFDGRELDASVQTLVGEVDIILNLSSDRSRLSGQLTHSLTGGVTAFEMYR